MQAAQGGARFFTACIHQACNAQRLQIAAWLLTAAELMAKALQFYASATTQSCSAELPVQVHAPCSNALQCLCARQAGESEEDNCLPVLESVQCLAAAWQGAGLATGASRGNDLAHALAQAMSPGK